MSLTFSNAVTIAQMELNKLQCFGSYLILLPEDARATPYGWLIPFAQSDFRATKELKLGGNLPFFVDRFTGEVCQPPVGHQNFEDWLTGYGQRHGYAALA